jgi:hypothetical protein
MMRSNRQHRSQRLAALMFALLLTCTSPFAAKAQKAEPIYIGDATMAADGTIAINLRRTADSINVTGVVNIQPMTRTTTK